MADGSVLWDSALRENKRERERERERRKERESQATEQREMSMANKVVRSDLHSKFNRMNFEILDHK